MSIIIFKNLFRNSRCFDNLQKIHILRAVPAMKKPFSMGLLSWLALLIALLAIKSHCWEKNMSWSWGLNLTGKQKPILCESTRRKDSRQWVENVLPSHNYIYRENIETYNVLCFLCCMSGSRILTIHMAIYL